MRDSRDVQCDLLFHLDSCGELGSLTGSQGNRTETKPSVALSVEGGLNKMGDTGKLSEIKRQPKIHAN